MKKLFVFTAIALGVATLNSCTQEDTTMFLSRVG